MYKVYILQSEKSLKYYIGSCYDIDKRVKLHNSGRVRSTKSSLPWILVYFEEFNERTWATARERQIKSWKKRSAIEKLLKNLRIRDNSGGPLA